MNFYPASRSGGSGGTDGVDGQDGASAYEIALDNGFIGTEIEWVASLQPPTTQEIDALVVAASLPLVKTMTGVAGNITLDMESRDGVIHNITASGDFTLGLPSNMIDGATYQLRINSGSFTPSFSPEWSFGAVGSPATFSESGIDLVVTTWNDSHLFSVYNPGFPALGSFGQAAFITAKETAGAAYTPTEKTALQKWYDDGQTNGWWSKGLSCGLFIDGFPAANLVNVIDPVNNLTENGTPIHHAKSVETPGANTINLRTSPIDGSMDTLGFSICIQPNDVGDDDAVVGSSTSSSTNRIYIRRNGSRSRVYTGSLTNIDNFNIDSTLLALYTTPGVGSPVDAWTHDGSTAARRVTGSIISSDVGAGSTEFVYGARNAGGDFSTTGRHSFIWIGNGFTDTEATNFLIDTRAMLSELNGLF